MTIFNEESEDVESLLEPRDDSSDKEILRYDQKYDEEYVNPDFQHVYDGERYD